MILFSSVTAQQKPDYKYQRHLFLATIDISVPVYFPEYPYKHEVSSGHYDIGDINFQLAEYKVRFPSLGLSYVLNKRNITLRSDLLFWTGIKELNTNYAFYSRGNAYTYTVPYYNFVGKINDFNLDLDLQLGLKVDKAMAITFGIRKNFPLYYSVNGDLTVKQTTYSYAYVNGISGYYPISTETQIYHDNASKSQNKQVYLSTTYFNFGLNYSTQMLHRYSIFSLQYGLPKGYLLSRVHISDHVQFQANYVIINLKLAMLLNQTKE